MVESTEYHSKLDGYKKHLKAQYLNAAKLDIFFLSGSLSGPGTVPNTTGPPSGGLHLEWLLAFTCPSVPLWVLGDAMPYPKPAPSMNYSLFHIVLPSTS